MSLFGICIIVHNEGINFTLKKLSAALFYTYLV